MTIEASIVCDSISEQEKRLTTFKLRYPKFIHAEFMTHRVISRNASSSRAVPTKRLIAEVRDESTRAAPIFWGKNQPGMQAAEELDDSNDEDGIISDRQYAKEMWADSANKAAGYAENLLELGVHKQIVNRILEPYMHIDVVASATEWDNFFGLRLHKDAQPEMRALAIAMWEARKASTPKLLKPGEWHLPFIKWEGPNADFDTRIAREPLLQQCIKVSVARCARVSYKMFDTDEPSTVEKDLELYEKLLGANPIHASPAEHQATPDSRHIPEYAFQKGAWMHQHEHGNFVGWRQYRKILPGESCAPLPEDYT